MSLERFLRHECRKPQEATVRTKIQGLFPCESRISRRHVRWRDLLGVDARGP